MLKLTKNIILIIIAVAAAVAVLSMSKVAEKNTAPRPETKDEVVMEEFKSEELGLSFEYRKEPHGYTLVDRPAGMEGDTKVGRTLVLMNTKGYAEVMESGIPTEGPPVISVTIFNNPGNMSSRQWAETNAQYSLMQLALSPITNTTVSGVPAITYKADGLYPMDMYIVANNSKIYVIAGGYNSPEDKIKKDFEEFLKSIEFF